MPQAKTLWLSTWEKGKGFVRKAGTFIFGGSVVIWLLNYAGPSGFGVDMGDSFLAMIGGFIAPLFAPLGFGTWQAAADQAKRGGHYLRGQDRQGRGANRLEPAGARGAAAYSWPVAVSRRMVRDSDRW